MSYVIIGIIIVFVVVLLAVGFIMDKEDVENRDE